MVDKHEFLFDRNDELRESVKAIPKIREYIDNLPETALTFRLTQIDDVYPPSFEDIHLELCGSWRLHEIYEPSRDRVYVNPSYPSIHEYSDVVVECECGAVLSRNYDTEHNSLRNEHRHKEHCQPFHRLRARAEMSEKRYRTAVRCARKLGWNGHEIANRLGVRPSSIGQTLSQFGVRVSELRDEFRRRAARTYHVLCRERGVSGQLVADIYGVTRTTMGRWCRKFLEQNDGV